MSTIPPTTSPRLVSLDAYRGFIMLAIASGGLGFAAVVMRHDKAGEPVSPLMQVLGYQLHHLAWAGCAFWGLSQPPSMFMVGVAMPYSIASRAARGDTYGRRRFGAASPALLLVLLAVFLSTPQRELTSGGPTTNWV